jgi:hypothetical protein
MALPLKLTVDRSLGGLQKETADAPIAGAIWYTATKPGDGLAFSFPAGALAGANYLTADFLVDGNHLVVFEIVLQEGEKGPRFVLIFSALNQCSARIRMRMEAVNQNVWRYDREGAWLKPMCGGDRVDLSRVDRMTFTVARKSEKDARFCVTGFTACVEEPPLLAEIVLPKGPLVDEMGQSTLHDWPAKSRGTDEVTGRLKGQLAAAPAMHWPAGFSRWGGWLDRRVQATGFFRIHHDGKRWWLVDPDGYLFWSSGMDCVRVNTDGAYSGLEKALTWLPDREGEFKDVFHGRGALQMINYLAANLIRAFGKDEWYEKWSRVALAELKRMGFNTVANWSDWTIASAAGFPYVRPLNLNFKKSKMVYRDFPDVFHPDFAADASEFGKQLEVTKNDSALIGYFMMNEPTWGFASLTPAEGMLFNTAECASRRELAEFLKNKYRDEPALCAAWGIKTTFAALGEGPWSTPPGKAAKDDLAAFSSVMVDRFFSLLTESCRAVDLKHMNLGIRYYTIPPTWALKGMQCFDVFSVNGYDERVRSDLFQIADELNQPVLVGEWHFGALDAGLPASGIGHVRTQTDRGKAFRVYTEDAAAKPWCVGVHYFTLYDESALGRFDGENWQIGFLDVCNRPYDPLSRAARAAHERLYQVASGELPPFADAPEYLPKLFL